MKYAGFELALNNGYDCPLFIKAFMNSRTAYALDDVYDRLQWAGEEYVLEELNDEVNGLKKEIYKIADAKTMNESQYDDEFLRVTQGDGSVDTGRRRT